MKDNNKLNKQKLKFYYELTMTVLALVAAVIFIFECNYKLTPEELKVFNVLNDIILTVFAIDYFTRLYIAPNKKVFIKMNVIELLAIMPFNTIFQAARILKLVRLAKLVRMLKMVKLARALIFLKRFVKYIDEFLNTNNFNYFLWITVIIVFVGAIGMYLTEGRSFVDSLWWSFVTVTTVGYGDISPTTNIGRIMAAVLMLVGIGFIGMLTGTISTFFIKRKTDRQSLKSETIEIIKSKLDEYENLTDDDIEYLCRLLHILKN